MTDKPCDKSKCTACFACVNICPKNCIDLTVQNGAYYPQIDEEKCIDCKLCEKVCPANNSLEFAEPSDVYASYVKDENSRKASTSGGIASLISKKFIENGYPVYATSFGNSLNVDFCRYESLTDLENARGSKYVHSHTGKVFGQIAEDLKHGKVLFIGVPCQNAGLLNYIKALKTPAENLYTIDIICHGSPDRETFNQYSKYFLGEKYNLAKTVKFRKGNNYHLSYLDEKGKIIKSSAVRDGIYLSHFLDGYIFRENCYSCPYARKERITDITLGDFWGIGSEAPFDGDKTNGINAVLINTEKGKSIFNDISNDAVSYKRTLSEAVKGNTQLRNPAADNEYSKKFRQLCKSGNAVSAMEKCYPKKLILIKIRSFIHRHKILYSIIKKLPYLKEKF